MFPLIIVQPPPCVNTLSDPDMIKCLLNCFFAYGSSQTSRMSGVPPNWKWTAPPPPAIYFATSALCICCLFLPFSFLFSSMSKMWNLLTRGVSFNRLFDLVDLVRGGLVIDPVLTLVYSTILWQTTTPAKKGLPGYSMLCLTSYDLIITL